MLGTKGKGLCPQWALGAPGIPRVLSMKTCSDTTLVSGSQAGPQAWPPTPGMLLPPGDPAYQHQSQGLNGLVSLQVARERRDCL